MPLQKILFKPGVNKENTRYTTEGGWYDCDKVRFRQGNPEVHRWLGAISLRTNYLGVCRSLVELGDSLVATNLIGIGTNLKFYIELKAVCSMTSRRFAQQSTINTDPFTAGNGYDHSHSHRHKPRLRNG